jgi:hypothetical protein
MVVLLGTCVQQDIDVEKLVRDRMIKIPTLPMPTKGKERIRGLRL